jgi:hypothetical protein
VAASAARARVRLGFDLLSAHGRLAAGRGVGAAARAAIGGVAIGRRVGVVTRGRRLQPSAGKKGGSQTGLSPVDRARNGSKHHLLVDARGIPLAWTVTGGNHNHVTQLVPLVERVPPVRGRSVSPPTEATTTTSTGASCAGAGSAQRLLAARPPRLRPRPYPLGRRAHLRLAAPVQATARPLRPSPRDPRSVPRHRLLPRLFPAPASV